ncbi:MAG: hypothetical protein B6I24_08160 [Bacteroidetes bacterium 4572_128]|nr:MAG: hypothetical protein B6I24_08160 [Bacteroidetes bacterium 4572_128]
MQKFLIDEDFFKTNEKIKSFSFASFFKTKIGKNFTLKTKIIYSQNLFEHLTLGGYAISSIDKKTGKETYTPTNHFNIWTNIVYEKNYRFSIYGGFLKNLGTTDDIIENSIFYARGENIDNLYKITSHISKKINKFQIAFETERTTVSYGKIDFENKGKIKNTKAVTDYRFLFVVMYFF